jgi:sugar lactone lactonase YvrE
MLRRRIALLATALPLAFYADACSDDPPTSPATGEDAGKDGAVNNIDGGPLPDGSVDTDAGDAGDGGIALTCVGNPLTEDGGTEDGGVLINPDGGALKAIATGPFLDGPQWIDDGIVYSEVNNQVIVRNGPDGGARILLRATGAGNLPIGNARSGNFVFTALATVTGGAAILRMQLDGGDPVTFDAGPPANSPNDLVASTKSFVYFTDPGFQAPAANPVTGVYRIGSDGMGIVSVQQFDAGANPGSRADGIALSQDESRLYVGFFDERRIAKYTIDAAGVASAPQNIPFTPINNPTGIAVDVGGNLWIAENDPTLIRGRIEVIDAAGKKWGEIPLPDSRPTGIAFGGADGRTVYITTERDVAEGTLYVLTSRCSGVR